MYNACARQKRGYCKRVTNKNFVIDDDDDDGGCVGDDDADDDDDSSGGGHFPNIIVL